MTDTKQTDQMATRIVPLTIHAQYIKDLSFENPNAPQALKPGQTMPNTSVNVTMDARKIDENFDGAQGYEMVLHIESAAMRGDKTMFLIELDYAVICSIPNEIPEKHRHPLLMVEAPKMAFPFARQILAEVTSNGGFPPLLLTPVDFEGMYRDEYLAQQAKAPAQGTA